MRARHKIANAGIDDTDGLDVQMKKFILRYDYGTYISGWIDRDW